MTTTQAARASSPRLEEYANPSAAPTLHNAPSNHRRVVFRNPILNFIFNLGSGILLDIRARAPYYGRDWTDAWNYRVVPATALIFFANVLPGIAFSLDLIETTQQYGVVEVLLASFMAAFIFSVFGAQPLTIAGVTGPITVFNKTIFRIIQGQPDAPIYLHFVGWVYLWAAIIHWVTAILNWCNFLKYVTLFSCDTFGFYVSWVYLQYGIQVLTRQLDSSALPGALSLSQKTLFHRHVRQFLADYGMPISLVASSAMAYWGRFNATDPQTLPISGAFQPANGRAWLVPFWQLEGKWVGIALPFGIILWILFFFDHNVSSLMAQGSEFPLRKPPGFHYDFFLLGITTFLAGLLGVPAPNGLIPQAPIHTTSLLIMGRPPKKDDEENQNHPSSDINEKKKMSSEWTPEPLHQPIAVVEQRVSNLAQGSLCLVLLSGPFLHVLNLIPRGVLAGLFWFMGADALNGNGITQKIFYFFRDRKLTPNEEPLRRVRKSRIILFIAIQLVAFGATFAITQTIAAIGFPIIIMALIPIRIWLIPRLPFTVEELAILDGPTASLLSERVWLTQTVLFLELFSSFVTVTVKDPTNYNPANTVITPLGLREELLTGQYLRNIYLNSTSPSFIKGITSNIADPNQITVIADAAGEGGVIMNSAEALLQGLFPPNADYNTTLANGTIVEAPLGGYQYIEIESALSENDVTLEGWTSCDPFDAATADFYNSALFNQTEQDNADFFANLPQYLDGRGDVNLQNMWNIFDYMNVQSIHNSTFDLPEQVLAQGRTLAAFHEYGVFTSPQLGGIGNIGLRTMLPGIFEGISSIANSSDPLKIYYNAIAYKSFFTLFNMTGADTQDPSLTGLVNYAASVAIEVRQPDSGGEPVLRLQFKNGTKSDAQSTLNWFNTTGDIPVSMLTNYLSPVAINSTADWCTVCSNTQDRGCGAIAAAATQAALASRVHQPISPVGAGFLGAGLVLFVALCLFGMMAFLGCLTFGKRARRSSHRAEASSTSRGSDSDLVEKP
ncbi:hypothetical protein D9757_007845 [Collybiopsis confluens]|uniref:Bicarbonate transporter-like transmembrane domain-containing protein n=1 Tax=Collybiopsis confluens TaxID=2823264 RepID=A0A8H5HDB5_9AGAR|nr:hypothetical protein D9757_007845 [Collybiopsis confluens]